MIKQTFRMPGTMPDHIFFSNNCQLAKHVWDDPDFNCIRLSVDVFYFKSKHSITDTFCQAHCNPVAFSELRGEGDKDWYFTLIHPSQSRPTAGWAAIIQSAGKCSLTSIFFS
jgi:hypothetical protein